MNNFEEQVPTAIHRLQDNTTLLNGAISGLELMIRHAENLDHEKVRRALPFLELM